ncbi:MAG: flagellar protein FliT [Fibrobacter sp.]|nr:flagellar protein FliT [Fibrobacter sp.]
MNRCTQKISDQLEVIKKLYQSVKDATAQLCKNLTMDKVEEVIEERNQLLVRISAEENLFKKLRVENSLSEDNKIKLSEIRELIRSIVKLDNTISVLVKHEMDTVNNELSGFYKTSKAALAYASHRK